MQVSVETLNGLERKVTVSVPPEKLEEEVSLRLKDLARKVKLDGFRPGKAPLNAVKSRYSANVRDEVTREMVKLTLQEALMQSELVPAGMPRIEPEQFESGKEFIYSAFFEVFPKFEINELNQAEVEIVHAKVKSKDVDNMIEKLREQNREWQEVSREIAKNDKLIIDFEGFIEDKPFSGGKAEGFEIIVGSGNMIPGFEEGLIGGTLSKPFDIKVSFPKEYHQQELAGKEAVFKIVVKKIMEGKLPSLDEAFAEKFNIKEGGIDALKQEIKGNMEHELERRLNVMNREKLFAKLRELNPFDVPMALVDEEIKHLKHETFHRIYGPEHSDNEKIPDFPRELFEEQAKRRVHLGLLLSDYVKKHEIIADDVRVDAKIEKLASVYEKPQELRAWYQESQERRGDIQALVTEEMVAEKIAASAKIIEKSMSYEEVINPTKKEGE